MATLGMTMMAAMSTHRAYAAALNQKRNDEISRRDPMYLTKEEIREIRMESRKDYRQTMENGSNSTGYREVEDANPLPKCSFCCTIM